jgi:uncharacterized protein YcsI (UPF0317 family)
MDLQLIGCAISFSTLMVNVGIILLGRHVAKKIMYNDLKHLGGDLNALVHTVDSIADSLKVISDRQIVRDSICEERHAPRRERKPKK